ncbi:NAD(P)-dependent oxidoreductase [Niveibacterium umoris]|uniref:NAD(P)-binding domain-containing protein n=1 Tax=Niveibacterium umoris TaxID=1193620 RepID=A0A840BPV8_9RHOO|nr:NAD(P)-dependent oxidoreductase [Niveibacterium umoris]MBB4013558.1 hypothetical protein [Niveibacterium umoris]
MNIALIGASGFVGAALLHEALSRGHQVTAIVRDTTKLQPAPQLTVEAVDLFDAAALAAALRGHDAVISAYNPGWAEPEIRARSVAGGEAVLAAAKSAGVPRLLVVGGAGSLEVAPGVQAVDTQDFPPQWKEAALGMRDLLERLRGEQGIAWTYLSPAFELFPGDRSGHYRLGGDQAFFDAQGHSRISNADYAVALIDELERAAHTGRRFSVAY